MSKQELRIQIVLDGKPGGVAGDVRERYRVERRIGTATGGMDQRRQQMLDEAATAIGLSGKGRVVIVAADVGTAQGCEDAFKAATSREPGSTSTVACAPWFDSRHGSKRNRRKGAAPLFVKVMRC